jgi:hypothetical protein
MAHDRKYHVSRLYRLDGLSATDVRVRVAYLLENDRYICYPNKYDESTQFILFRRSHGSWKKVCGWRFPAPEIKEMVEQKLFAGKKHKDTKDPPSLLAINDKLIVHVTTSLGTALSGWTTWLWVTPPNVKSERELPWYICPPKFVYSMTIEVCNFSPS